MTTHYEGCYDGGPKHYECAMLEVKRLRGESEAHMNHSDKYEQIKDIKRLNPVELEATVVHHEQQIKDIAAHLLELKQLVTPMMQFKQDAAAKADYERGFDDGFFLRNEKDGKRTWVGLTGAEVNHIFAENVGYPERMMKEVEALLKDKNT